MLRRAVATFLARRRPPVEHVSSAHRRQPAGAIGQSYHADRWGAGGRCRLVVSRP
ncbi:hypothetical protein [Ornithinimicrobium kibberense]|uniref:hypothetical protein n=1 Tax=Ornithinimicrobium kibberense TaxID=282060 RepID=UPI00361E3BC5